MLEAAFWGLVGGLALVLGALLTFVAPPRPRTVGRVMAFGAGVLISAVAYELVAEAFRTAGGHGAVAAGIAAGALTFFAGDVLLARRGAAARTAAGAPAGAAAPEADTDAQAIALGAVLDGIPESVVIGVSLLSGGVSAAMVAAVFISNIPEAVAATDGLVRSGTPRARVLALWGGLALTCAAAAAVGYGVVGALPGAVAAFVQAFAAGALLTMLGDTMVPEAYARAGRVAGLLLVLGFAVSFGLTAAQAAA